MCCTGNPYPPEGQCSPMCNLKSDRTAKQDFAPVDDDRILERVSSLPVTEWSYKTEPSVRHIGPMAQDFRAAFGVGRDERTIDTVDELGVTLAALQALDRRVDELEAETRALRADNARLRSELQAASSLSK